VDRPQEELMEAVLAKESLRATWLQVKANDGAAGIDKMSVGRTKEHSGSIGKRSRRSCGQGSISPQECGRSAQSRQGPPDPGGGGRVWKAPAEMTGNCL
jgi:hypothetical protein